MRGFRFWLCTPMQKRRALTSSYLIALTRSAPAEPLNHAFAFVFFLTGGRDSIFDSRASSVGLLHWLHLGESVQQFDEQRVLVLYYQ